MAFHPPQRRHSFELWLRRLDRAAARMNPYLTLLIIGLVVLNLTCIALLAMRLPVTHDSVGFVPCPPTYDCTGRIAATR